MVVEPVKSRPGHLGVAGDRRPLTEGQVGSDDYRGSLVELVHQLEEPLAAGPRR